MDLLIDFTDCPEHTLDQRERAIKRQLFNASSGLGPFVTALVHSLWVMRVKSTVEEAQRLLGLEGNHPTEHIEAACRRALFHRRPDFLTVDQILRRGVQDLPLDPYCNVWGQPRYPTLDHFDECGIRNHL
jgi:hypothetical protein